MGLILFVVMGYVGCDFIVAVQRSAAVINQDPALNKNKELDFSRFQNSIPLPRNRQVNVIQHHDFSIGDELVITAGELVYQSGQPTVRVALHNRGGFAIDEAMMSLLLFLDGDKQAIASAVGVPVSLKQPLLPEEHTVVSLSITEPVWQDEVVRRADTRRVLAQVISVRNSDDQNTEYSQTGQGVYLKQTVNDWSVPSNDELSLPDDAVSDVRAASVAPPDFADPTADLDLHRHKPIKAVPIQPVTELTVDEHIIVNHTESTPSKSFRQPETPNGEPIHADTLQPETHD